MTLSSKNNYGGKKFDGCGSDGNPMKLRWDLVPWESVEEIVKIYTHGAIKYGDNQWQGVEPDRYFGALMRHLIAWRKGEIKDPDSGLPHLAHVGWNIFALLWFEINKEARDEPESEQQV